MPKYSHTFLKIGITTGAMLLAGCSQLPKMPDFGQKPAPKTTPKPPSQQTLSLRPIDFNQMRGWNTFGGQSVLGAGESLRRSCAVMLARPASKSVGNKTLPMTAGEWHPACKMLTSLNRKNVAQTKAFFEQNFTPLRAEIPNGSKGGLFTGYYEAELHGSRQKTGKYQHPIYGLPNDLVTINLGKFDKSLQGRTIVAQVQKNRANPYPKRQTIETKKPNAPVLYYVDDYVDLFVLHVQGAGRVVLNDGTVRHVGYAGNNGHTFGSVATHLMKRHNLPPSQASWQGIRKWLDKNPNKQISAFSANPRYIFFRDTGTQGPFGAMGVALTPKHSMAVDPKFIPLGLPLWLETTQPASTAPLNTMVIAQDTGNAIKGAIRGDFFWGYGDPALAKAGKMKSRGTYVLLLPNPMARRMGL